ncbi:MAG: hypothetical protein NZ602_04515 [Thermoguttaceae bacterium]|nr:hypothetical protein [Thermoguttaceae bacterium]MDW8036611.1 hypothetical protein [Thermoguttaceae bacterium]
MWIRFVGLELPHPAHFCPGGSCDQLATSADTQDRNLRMPEMHEIVH